MISDENKVVLAMNHLGHIFYLVTCDNDRWKDFGLQTIQNCSTNGLYFINFLILGKI